MKALDLTQGPITRTLIAFTLPTLGSNVLQSLNASVNAIWVGHFLGEAPLTATTNANMVLFLLMAAVFGVVMATGIMVGQSVGARDLTQAKRVVGSSAVFIVLLSLATARHRRAHGRADPAADEHAAGCAALCGELPAHRLHRDTADVLLHLRRNGPARRRRCAHSVHLHVHLRRAGHRAQPAADLRRGAAAGARDQRRRRWRC